MKKCPLSNKPIDLMHLKSGGPYQITSPGFWTSPVFEDLDDAIDYRASIDVVHECQSARREERNGKVRLVSGSGDFMTSFFMPAVLDALLAKHDKPAAAPVKKQVKKTNASVDTSSNEA